MIDREVVEGQNKSLATRLKFAGLRRAAVAGDIDLTNSARPRPNIVHQPCRRRSATSRVARLFAMVSRKW